MTAIKTFFGVLFVLLFAVAVTSQGALKGPDAFALRWAVITLAVAISGFAAWLRSRPRSVRPSAPVAPNATQQLRTGAADIEAAGRQAIVFRRHFPPRHQKSTLSFFGGAPIAPRDFRWPRPVSSEQQSKPFSFLMQIDCAAVPAAGRLGMLPDRGVLYFFHDLTWKQADVCRVIYADAQDIQNWRVVEPPDDLGPAFGDKATFSWKWTQSLADCPRLLPKWTFDPVLVELPAPVRDPEEGENAPIWWPSEKVMAERLRAAQGENVLGNWFNINDFIGADGKLRRSFANYPHDWRAVHIASGLLAERMRHTFGLMGTSFFKDRPEAEREALTKQIREEAMVWYNRAASHPPFAAVPQSESDEFWSWLETYPWLLRFVITEAVTQSIEASLVESEEAAARIPTDVALRIRHRHALTVQSERGLFASTPDRMLAPPVDVQGHQWDRAKTHLLLLELSSNDALGHHWGEGVYQFWITPADLRARRFDKVQLTADAY